MPFPEKPLLSSTTNRRKMIGSLGLTGLGMLVSSNSASAFTGGATPKVTVNTQTRVGSIAAQQTLDFSDLPEEWVHREADLLPG